MTLVNVSCLALCAVFAFSTVSQAQTPSNSSEPCCTIDPQTVDPETRSSWCIDQRYSCRILCNATIVTDNSCASDTLTYSCTCDDNLIPDLSRYNNTMPSYKCQEWVSQCISKATPSQTQQQTECVSVKCGSEVALALPPASMGTSTPTSFATSPRSTRVSVPFSGASSTSASSSAFSGSTDEEPKAETSLGEIAGIVVGGVLGGLMLVVLAVVLYKKQQKDDQKMQLAGPRGAVGLPSDEKQTAVPEIIQKPELHAESGFTYSSLPQVVDHAIDPRSLPTGASELHSTPYHSTFELYSHGMHQNPELQGSSYYTPVELHATEGGHEMDAGTRKSYSLPLQSIQSEQNRSHGLQLHGDTEDSRSILPISAPLSTQRFVPEDVAALEEEERRIDAEMEEARRMKELREQKYAIQQKLKEAKGR